MSLDSSAPQHRHPALLALDDYRRRGYCELLSKYLKNDCGLGKMRQTFDVLFGSEKSFVETDIQRAFFFHDDWSQVSCQETLKRQTAKNVVDICATMADIFLIVSITVAFLILLVAAVYLLVYYQHPDDHNEAYFPKVVVILGIVLAGTTALLLPLDVANNEGYPGEYKSYCCLRTFDSLDSNK